MSTVEVAAVVVAVAAVLGVVVLGISLARLDRTVRSVGASVELLRFESVPLTAGGELAAGQASGGKLRVAKDPGTLVAKVARANPVLDVSDPIVKVLAIASGTGRAATRFRRARRDR